MGEDQTRHPDGATGRKSPSEKGCSREFSELAR